MDIAVHTAEKLGMKLWLLDDLCFPTGYANGAIEKKYPELRHWHIAEFAMDVAGPMDGAKVLLQSDIEHKNEEFILSVVAFPRHKNRTDWTNGIDLTDHVRGDFLYWDVPEGLWTVLSISKTRAGGERPNYIDMMNPNSVDKLIEAVYEPHYARYKDYFGKTFAGFFSEIFRRLARARAAAPSAASRTPRNVPYFTTSSSHRYPEKPRESCSAP